MQVNKSVKHWTEVTHEVLVHAVNFVLPQDGTQLANGLDESESVRVFAGRLGDIVDMKSARLHEGLEVLPNKIVPVLHHICGTDWGDGQATYIRGLKAHRK